MNPQPPKLYSLIKIHKQDYPVRPIVSFVTSPSVKLSEKLISIILTHTNFVSTYSIKNTYNLVENIKDICIPNNAKLISFDVQNLFPSIPPKDVIKLVQSLLDKNNINPITKEEIIDSLKICLKQNYFQFNNNIYTCEEGLIMGNPLSPLLADIFMNSMETTIHKHPLIKNFIFWYRYVDDIITCFIGTNRQLNHFLEFINSLHDNIKFTIELETNNSINFLDLTIQKLNNKFDFSIYRKPTCTDITIHNSSAHPYKHKLSVFNSLIHRLTNIPMLSESFDKELNVIKQIAINNGYSPNLIDSILNKKLYNIAIKNIFPIQKEQYISSVITYIGFPSHNINRFLNKINIKTSYRTNNNLSKYIKNNKDKVSKHDMCGVYKLTCGSCPKIYIGQTGRTFKQRFLEHRNSFINQKSNSAFADHLIQENHDFCNDFEIMHVQNKGPKLNFLESLEINKYKNSDILTNNQIDLNCSPLLNLY